MRVPCFLSAAEPASLLFLQPLSRRFANSRIQRRLSEFQPRAFFSTNQSQASQSANQPSSQSETTKSTDKMATDEDYMAFLDKANQDPNERAAKTDGKVEFKATDAGVEIPKVLRDATRDAWYTSDADEKFVPVALKYGGKSLPDEGLFCLLFPPPPPYSSPPFSCIWT